MKRRLRLALGPDFHHYPLVIGCPLFKDMQCVLVPCCGIPASGKTTFCRVVKSAASCTNGVATDASMEENSRVQTSIRVSHVCFDEHIDLARRKLNARSPVFVGEGDNNDRAARQREDCEDAGVEGEGRATCSKRKLDDNVKCEVNGGFEDGEEGAESWHDGRSCAMAEVEALAAGARKIDSQSTHMTDLSVTGVAASPSAKSSLEENQKGSHGNASLHVVLVDDNMHFRSMRHDVLRLARKYGCGYAQVYFPTEVEIAIRRNEERTNPVPEVVIRKMATSIQPPDPLRFKWERYTMVIRPSTFPRRSGGVLGRASDSHVQSTHRNDGMSGDEAIASAFHMFWETVAAAAQDPVPPVSALLSNNREQEKDRKATKASALHQLDLELREAVKSVADKAGEVSLSRETFRAVMGACAAARRTVMRHARMMDEDDNDTRKTEAEIGGIQSDQVNNPGHTGGKGAAKLATSACSLLQAFAGEFGQGIEVLDGLGACTREVLVEAARGCDKLNQPGV